ncbi:excalibur calcium-binding domain-containing protein [Corynebacterium glyciniphilum]|uniref:excalibur calcium-binding domain-containing protein n=1 Tax=Corynebacterium glyciniphilum TaxID=1404244 RepID=UPI003FD207A3
MTAPNAGNHPGQRGPAARIIKPTLATISLVLGGITFLSSLFTLSFPGILISLAIALPGAWWFLHERKVKAGAPMKRHWGVIAAVAVAAFIGGGLLLPATEPTEEAEAAVETTSAAPTSTSTSSPRPTTSISQPTTTARPSRTTTTPITTTHEPAPAATPAPAHREPTPERSYTPPPAPAPDPAPAPAPEPEYTPPPAPAPESVYYANCTAARAAGAAPVLAGQPGYGTHLDRDGDGIGCEN